MAPDGGVVHGEAVSLLAGRNGMSVVRRGKSISGYWPCLGSSSSWLSSDCIPRENQPGVDQVTGQCGSECKPVIFCDTLCKLVLIRKRNVNKNSQG